eukprot:SAG25_NODE_11183_length_311_cov_1.202830_1_plen_69_part_01
MFGGSPPEDITTGVTPDPYIDVTPDPSPALDIMIAYVLQIIQSRVTDGKCPKNYPPLHVDSATVAGAVC